MFENVCTLPLTSELFTQTLHPTEPLLAVGLSAGHVQTYRLPSERGHGDGGRNGDSGEGGGGLGKVDVQWRTRRHKGSCRCLGFAIGGDVLYSAGTDAIVKAASSRTGQVISKIAIPPIPDTTTPDAPTLLHSLSPQTLLLATDSSALHLYDIRQPNQQHSHLPSQTHHPHDDYISSLTPLPASGASTSGYSKQWVTTGGTTLAVTDLRQGVLVRSEDQEEELLCSAFVNGLSTKPKQGGKVIVGGAGGVLTLWEKGVWDDQGERIIVDRGAGGGESLDTLTMLPPAPRWSNVPLAAVGLGDGRIRLVKLGGLNKLADTTLQHDDVEGVVGLGVDVEGRLISGGGMVVKVWSEMIDDEEEDEGEESEEEAAVGKGKKRRKPMGGSDVSDSDEEEEAEDSSDGQEGNRKRRRKRKRNATPRKQQSHILGFKGMD
ncbi:MAG: WD repeat-containing protein jip5 [Geoglossum umbratile]|nr:MAG: WD repeat-containing protein jip5 [Geoglossum umbratile]